MLLSEESKAKAKKTREGNKRKEAYERLPIFLKLVEEGWSNTCAMGRARITDYLQRLLMKESEEFRNVFTRRRE